MAILTRDYALEGYQALEVLGHETLAVTNAVAVAPAAMPATGKVLKVLISVRTAAVRMGVGTTPTANDGLEIDANERWEWEGVAKGKTAGDTNAALWALEFIATTATAASVDLVYLGIS